MMFANTTQSSQQDLQVIQCMSAALLLRTHAQAGCTDANCQLPTLRQGQRPTLPGYTGRLEETQSCAQFNKYEEHLFVRVFLLFTGLRF